MRVIVCPSVAALAEGVGIKRKMQHKRAVFSQTQRELLGPLTVPPT